MELIELKKKKLKRVSHEKNTFSKTKPGGFLICVGTLNLNGLNISLISTLPLSSFLDIHFTIVLFLIFFYVFVQEYFILSCV